jgi:hypothetical protein
MPIMDPAFYAAVYGITPIIPTTPVTTATTITTMMTATMMMTSLKPETTTFATRLATTAVSSTTTSDFLVRSVNISGNQGMKVSGNMSHKFIPMHVAHNLQIKSTTKKSTPSTIGKIIYPTKARVTTTTSMSITTSRERVVYTPKARLTTTTTRSRQFVGVRPFVPYPYWKDKSASQVKLPEKGSNLTRLVKPAVHEETRRTDPTYGIKDRRMLEWNLDRIIGPVPYREPLRNVSNVSLIKDSDHIIPYHVPVVLKNTETQLIDTTVVTETTTEISTKLSSDVSTKMEDTTNYGLVFMSSALLFLVGTIPLYGIIGRLVRNISRLKKQRPTYHRVNTDIDLIMRLDNIEGQMINCKRLIGKNMKRNMPTVASVENMVSFVHRRV